MDLAEAKSNCSADLQEIIQAAELVKLSGMLNKDWTQVPVRCKWNLQLFELLEESGDAGMIKFMRYGWPLNRAPDTPLPVDTDITKGPMNSQNLWSNT